jgi:hypothetical protein
MRGASTKTAGFFEDVERWRQAAHGRVPSYHRVLHELCALLRSSTPEGAEIERRLQSAWAARVFHSFYERPLLVIAGLRMEALSLGETFPLWAALAGPEPGEAPVTRDRLLAALSCESVWELLRTRFVQTNETSRAVVWLWPAWLAGCTDGRRSLALCEAGAAAGLNLVADRLPSPWSDAAGQPLLEPGALQVDLRLGIDHNPLDARDERDANWLRACVWAGEHERSARLEAAIAAFRAAPATLERGDLSEVPARLRAISAERTERTLVLAVQTIVRDYLPEGTRAAYEAAMRQWIADAPPASAVWVELELDVRDASAPLPIIAHVRDGAQAQVADLCLGTTGYHPRTVQQNAAAVERFARLFC